MLRAFELELELKLELELQLKLSNNLNYVILFISFFYCRQKSLNPTYISYKSLSFRISIHANINNDLF